jgi:predicted phage terminase large subunit-like protein
MSEISPPPKSSPHSLLSELLRRKNAATSLEAYTEYLDLGFTSAAHHKLLITALEEVERGECSKLAVFMPPGSAKSTYASRIFPAWFLGRHPEASVIAASHTAELAERFGRLCRNLVAVEPHRNVFGVGVAMDRQAAGQWETERGGEYFAIGIGGALTGRRGDLAILDDPVKGREDADSERSKQTTWDWYVNDWLPRLKPGAAQVLIQTRWSEDDLGGRILEREASEWKVISLAMEALPGDPLGREPGEQLWPEWFVPSMIEGAKRDVRSWNALYQQRPVVEEGDYFKLNWFSPFVNLPESISVYGASDYAVTEGGGDYTEHGIFALDPLGTLYIIDWWRGQTAPDIWINKQCDLILKHSPMCWFGEKGVIEKAIAPALRHRMNERRAYCRMEWLPSVHVKPARARSFQALASMGKVMVPITAGWKAELLGQLTRFPAGKFDDGVDVCSLIGRGLETVRLPAQLNVGRNRRRNPNHRSEYDPYAIREDEIEKGAFH